MSIFFRPDNSVAADFIPFYHKGRYHLFYIRDWRDEANHGKGTPWHHLVTDDFVTFEDWGEAVPRGSKEDQDLWVFTGCVFERDSIFHIFYTGHNFLYDKSHRPQEAIMHATSTDLRTWTKDTAFKIFAPPQYEPHDWRDPFVYWDEETREFGMLLAARKTLGPSQYRGCVALLKSSDLQSWTVDEPFWQPNLYYTHECPDLLRIGDWWYLVYSTFSEQSLTHYRMCRSLNGPWLLPNAANGGDSFDGRPWYAAKTAGDDKQRFIFGWLATRSEDKDTGNWQWGGDLVVHQVHQAPDGTLSVAPPATVLNLFRNPYPLNPQPVLGQWEFEESSARCDAPGAFAASIMGELPITAMISAKLTLNTGSNSGGLFFRAGKSLDEFYLLRIEPSRQRVTFDRRPRPDDNAFICERPVALDAGAAVSFQAIIDDTCFVVYINGLVALSCRMYDLKGLYWGVFVSEGGILAQDLNLLEVYT